MASCMWSSRLPGEVVSSPERGSMEVEVEWTCVSQGGRRVCQIWKEGSWDLMKESLSRGSHPGLDRVCAPPSPSRLAGFSPCTGFERPVSCIELRLVIYFTYGNIHVSMLFS